MQYFVYLLAYPLLWCISRLPFPLLYLVSDVVFVLLYYVIGYRKKTVRGNLKLAFPDWSEKERLVIERKSYRHLCDMFLEMIKTLSISEKEIKKRFQFTNIETYQALERENKSVAMMVAHYASYEWAISMNYYVNFKGYAIYKRIANPYFDKLVHDIRSRFQAYLITTKDTIPMIHENEKAGIRGVYGFASDQSPKASRAYHWGSFMNATTPVHTGAEMLSKKFDMNVIFLKVKKVKRGHYEATFEVLSTDVKNVPDYQITDEFLKRVEQQINEAPEFYLWTHKRWKHVK
ncbi:KDO2-lipid IV(A) lauroyltransferase [Flavobacterium caeni]|uniref:KDO2-lipid IV(A) lauroyltransferase n=2 Tax=Flavobacterium caeni TaxID=490189 RepID=A0A1G5BTB7_9FLAO|nr:KDO2-lipid IV(A) lauroyltransferase [Flavobacterium caeni]